jgi:hypothetical protein
MQAFACLLLGFTRLEDTSLEFESHGAVSSVRVRELEDWTFSFTAAKNWVKVWVRPPEVRLGRLSFTELKDLLPQTTDRGDYNFTLRIVDVDEALRFLGLVYQSRES